MQVSQFLGWHFHWSGLSSLTQLTAKPLVGVQGQSPRKPIGWAILNTKISIQPHFFFWGFFFSSIILFFSTPVDFEALSSLSKKVFCCVWKKQMILFDDQQFSRLGAKMLKQTDNGLCTLCWKFLFLRLFQSKYSVKIFTQLITQLSRNDF